MAKVTSKLQLTVPKAIADRYKIRPGDTLEWVPAGDVIRVVPPNRSGGFQQTRSVEERLMLFRAMLDRQRRRERRPENLEEPRERPWKPHEIERGWRREDLYTRGRTR
jgi:bifunctional DNA-binding transcriptional regulator/antitoxin component of YhaV-PrlF toxin-antitoxin module